MNKTNRFICVETWLIWRERTSIRQSSIVFAFGFLTFMMMYGFEWMNFTLSIDEELAFFDSQFAHYIVLGRWGLALRVLLLPELTPYFTPLLCGLFMAAAGVAVTVAARLAIIPALIFVVALATFPQFAYQLEFSQQADGVALGICLATMATCAIYMLIDGKFELYCSPLVLLGLSIAAYAIAFSFYQSIIMVPLAVATILLMLDRARGASSKGCFRQLMVTGLMTALGALLYLVVLWGFRNFYNIPHGTNYLLAATGWGHPVGLRNLVNGLILRASGRAYFGEQVYAVALVAGICLAGIYTKRKQWLCAFFILCLLFVQVVFDVAFLQLMPARVQMAEAFVFAAVLTLLAINFPRLGLLLVAFSLLFGIYASSRLFYSDKMTSEADRQLAVQIEQAIFERYPDFNASITPVYLYGPANLNTPWRVPRSEIFGESVFRWDGGNVYRTQALFHYYDIMDFSFPDKSRRELLEPQIHRLPLWPNRHSIEIIDGVLIVRLGFRSGIE